MKLNECPKIFVCNFQISSQVPDFLSHLTTPCHSFSYLITAYPPGWTENHFHLATFKLVPRLLIFYHISSHLVTPYHTLSPRLERKPFSIVNFQISSQATDFLSHLITPCHSFSHLITAYPPGSTENHFHLETFKLVPRLLIFYHILSHLVTPYHTLSPKLERKPFSFVNFKISSED